MRVARCYRRIVTAIALLAISIATVAFALHWHRWHAMPPINFFGRVVDENGQPIADADVYVAICKVPPGTVIKHVADDFEDIRRLTDRGGRFEVRGRRGYILQITDIRKVGRALLYDFDWLWPRPTTQVNPDNRGYLYGGGVSVYLPDATRPAVFPLIAANGRSIAMPSRGGADRYSDAHVVDNSPTDVRIPSAGLDSPEAKGEDSMDCVRVLHGLRPIMQPTTSRPTVK